jgi:hypothetical protein
MAVKQILVYADSLSWGIIPDSRLRLPFEERWPGVMETELLRARRETRPVAGPIDIMLLLGPCKNPA